MSHSGIYSDPVNGIYQVWLFDVFTIIVKQQYNLSQVQFFKNGAWTYVTIDDKIPCRSNGNDLPME